MNVDVNVGLVCANALEVWVEPKKKEEKKMKKGKEGRCVSTGERFWAIHITNSMRGAISFSMMDDEYECNCWYHYCLALQRITSRRERKSG